MEKNERKEERKEGKEERKGVGGRWYTCHAMVKVNGLRNRSRLLLTLVL